MKYNNDDLPRERIDMREQSNSSSHSINFSLTADIKRIKQEITEHIDEEVKRFHIECLAITKSLLSPATLVYRSLHLDEVEPSFPPGKKLKIAKNVAKHAQTIDLGEKNAKSKSKAIGKKPKKVHSKPK
jgi:hypothetical protein